jgi:hypothetical protein
VSSGNHRDLKALQQKMQRQISNKIDIYPPTSSRQNPNLLEGWMGYNDEVRAILARAAEKVDRARGPSS